MKRLFAILIILSAILFSLSSCIKSQTKQKFTAYYFDWFDTATSIVGYENTKEDFEAVVCKIEALFDKYHKLYNIYLKYDGINNLATVNSCGAVNEIEVDSEILDLIDFSVSLYEKTDGKFNIAMGSVLSVWHRYRTEGLEKPESAALPKYEELKNASKHTDINNIITDRDNNTVFLKDPSLFLDVGAVAKGYACEKVAKYLEEQGHTGYLINAGGNIRTVGEKPDGKWNIGIENPDRSDEANPYIANLSFSGKALVTSGNYQRYYTVNGKNYHHIIDPDTLMPSEKYSSVSVLCNDAGVGDVLSTALFNMDLEKGQALINSLSDTEALWVLPNGDVKMTDGFRNYTDDK